MTDRRTPAGVTPTKSVASKKDPGAKAENHARMAAAKARYEARAEELIWFESREREPRQFDVAGIRSIRNFNTGRIEFKVPAKDVARFEANHFVTSGRIVRKSVK